MEEEGLINPEEIAQVLDLLQDMIALINVVMNLTIFLLEDSEEGEEEGEEERDVAELLVIIVDIISIINAITLALQNLEILNPRGRPLNIHHALFPNYAGSVDQGRDVFSSLVLQEYRFWDLTGETPESFLEIFNRVWFDIAQPRNVRLDHLIGAPREMRPTKLDLRNRLLVVIMWLRHYPRLSYLSFLFQVSVTTICDEIHHVIPILRYHLQDEIQWFTPGEVEDHRGNWPLIPNAIASLDCSNHKVNKPVENQGALYRGDKHYHFLNTLAVVDTRGRIRHLESGYSGRLNDTLVYHASLLGRGLLHLPQNAFILADGGFPAIHPLLIPFTENQALGDPAMLEANQIQRHYRSGVEVAFRGLKVRRCVGMVWLGLKPRLPQCVFVSGCLYNRRLRLLDQVREQWGNPENMMWVDEDEEGEDLD